MKDTYFLFVQKKLFLLETPFPFLGIKARIILEAIKGSNIENKPFPKTNFLLNILLSFIFFNFY